VTRCVTRLDTTPHVAIIVFMSSIEEQIKHHECCIRDKQLSTRLDRVTAAKEYVAYKAIHREAIRRLKNPRYGKIMDTLDNVAFCVGMSLPILFLIFLAIGGL